MRPGSVTVDLAAEQGGNIATTVPDEVITTDNVSVLLPDVSLRCAAALLHQLLSRSGVRPDSLGVSRVQGVICIGYTNLPARLPTQSSTLYASLRWPSFHCDVPVPLHAPVRRICRMHRVDHSVEPRIPDDAGCPTTSPSSCCPLGPSPRRSRAASMWTTRMTQCAAPWSRRTARSCGRRRRSRCVLRDLQAKNRCAGKVGQLLCARVVTHPSYSTLQHRRHALCVAGTSPHLVNLAAVHAAMCRHHHRPSRRLRRQLSSRSWWTTMQLRCGRPASQPAP